jgi:ferritin
MASFLSLVIALSMFTIVRTSSLTLSAAVGQCLSELVTQELSTSYNYLHLSSKFGTIEAYPGFSSLFTKLSDECSSKGYDLTKLLANRKHKVDRLISKGGIQVRKELTGQFNIRQGLAEARNDNQEAWKRTMTCHQEADNVNDAHTQDYLESHFLDHHVEINKLLADLENRIDDAQDSEKKLITFMIDEELLETYGDRRKNIFS